MPTNPRGVTVGAAEPSGGGPRRHDPAGLIEWAAAQPWSSGAVGLLGVSYLAISQWKAAALQRYRLVDEQRRRPLRDAWWRGLMPALEQITVPALICGSFSGNNLHSRSSFRGWERISSSERFLYTHRGGKWATFYARGPRRPAPVLRPVPARP